MARGKNEIGKEKPKTLQSRQTLKYLFDELSAECLLEDVLIRAVKRKATYQVQFKDYDRNTWTAPYILSQDRVKELLDDASIKKIRLEFEI